MRCRPLFRVWALISEWFRRTFETVTTDTPKSRAMSFIVTAIESFMHSVFASGRTTPRGLPYLSARDKRYRALPCGGNVTAIEPEDARSFRCQRSPGLYDFPARPKS